MYLSDISIKNPVFAWMLMIAIMVFGWIGFQRLGVSYFPDVDYPMIYIQITREGASPEIMETEVVDIIEDAIMSVDGVKEVLSSSKHSQASITVEFDLDKDIDIAFQDIQAKISQAQRLLPKDIDPPVILKVSPEDQPIMWIGLRGYRSPQELSDYVRYKLRPIFQAISGVADVMMGGFLDRNIRIWLEPKKLEAYQLGVDDVIRAIGREHIEVPAGRIENEYNELNLRFKGEAPSVESFKNIIISEFNGARIHLKDVAIVEDGLEDKRRIARIDGIPSQGIGIKKMRGANAVAVAKRVKEKIREIQEILPSDLEIFVSFDITQFIEDSIAEIEFALILAVIITAIVSWLFLGSISTSLNIILAIPTSLLGTFAVMYFSGFTLNMVTLLSLSLSVGIVVDDSIMVLENIYRHAEMGLARREAALRGARQITFAALAATLAIVAIFLPVAFMKGLVGRFFFQFGVTVSVAVLFSYLEAVTITPARCSQILTVKPRKSFIGIFVEGTFKILQSVYRWILPYCLRWRYIVVLFATVLLVISLSIIKFLRKEL
ncbi:MAG: efflux RND transporter permease subunit, partial [Planctomycetota bacterium]